MSRNLKGFSILGAVAVLVSVLLFTGCSLNNPVNTETNELADFGKRLDTKSMNISSTELDDAEIDDVVEDSKEILADVGGIIDIDRDIYHHKLEIEEYGLYEDATISVKSKKEKINNKEMISFEFGPTGLVFKKASKLDFEIAELKPNARSAKLYYYDPDAKSWVLQDTASVIDGRVVFDIYHFSKYAISD